MKIDEGSVFGLVNTIGNRVDALRSAAGIVIPEEEKEAQRYFLGVLTKMIQHDVNCLAEELR